MHSLSEAEQALAYWNGVPSSLKHIADSENSVFEFHSEGQRRFLRLTSAIRRSVPQIEAELAFVDYLHENGVRVATGVNSINGDRVKTIQSSRGDTHVCAFTAAPGKRYVYEDNFAQTHFFNRGVKLGRIHTLSRKYSPTQNRRRFSWIDDPRIQRIEVILPGSERTVRSAFDRCMKWMSNLRKSAQSFGLIHGDFGNTNFHLDGNEFTVFDFDDSCYHWYVYDLAVTMYPHGLRKNARQIAQSLFEGYQKETEINIELVELIKFCEWRMVYMFIARAEKWGFNEVSTEQEEWYSRMRENISCGYSIGRESF
jgi:amicoumacin kinase